MFGKSLLVLSALALASVPATADARGGRHGHGGWSGHHDSGNWSGRHWSGDRDYGRRHYRSYGSYYGGYDRFAVGYYGSPYYGGYYDAYYGAPYYGGGYGYYGSPYYAGYYGSPGFVIRIGDGGRRHHYRRYR